jgi:hypothetical protein
MRPLGPASGSPALPPQPPAPPPNRTALMLRPRLVNLPRYPLRLLVELLVTNTSFLPIARSMSSVSGTPSITESPRQMTPGGVGREGWAGGGGALERARRGRARTGLQPALLEQPGAPAACALLLFLPCGCQQCRLLLQAAPAAASALVQCPWLGPRTIAVKDEAVHAVNEGLLILQCSAAGLWGATAGGSKVCGRAGGHHRLRAAHAACSGGCGAAPGAPRAALLSNACAASHATPRPFALPIV